MEENFNEPEISSPAEQQPVNDTIRNLVENGILNPQQGQYCMSQLAKQRLTQDFNPAFEEFNREKPDFFDTEGRTEVLNYLRNSNTIVDKDEINTISQMVEKIEQCAIERYIKQKAHEKVLENENEAAKRRLTANAQNSTAATNKNKVFTREQIGRMSGAEFTKYEPLIMEQLRKGLIH